MIQSNVKSRQRPRLAWTREHLIRERSLALGQAIDTSTWKNYGSALNSYLTFVRIHDFPVEPTPDTLSFFIVFMCHHIRPKSVDSYLSGICQQLEPYFPSVRDVRKSIICKRTLAGCKRLRGVPTIRKRALSIDDLTQVIQHYSNSSSHDDLLFVSQILTGFFALMRLGELTVPDDKSIFDHRKITSRTLVSLSNNDYHFFLPGHKADKFFEGNTIIIQRRADFINPLLHFKKYLSSRDRLFPFSSDLWLRADGSRPSQTFFIRRMKLFFSHDVAGQSMRSGGATYLAELGVSPNLIQAIGRWASSAFQIYIRKNPVLLQALLFGRWSGLERRRRVWIRTSDAFLVTTCDSIYVVLSCAHNHVLCHVIWSGASY